MGKPKAIPQNVPVSSIDTSMPRVQLEDIIGPGNSLPFLARGYGSRVEAFLVSLAESGCIVASCRKAGVSYCFINNQRNKHPEFKALMDVALKIYVQLLEHEVDRRAFRGVQKPVFYKGEVVGWVDEFDSTLAIVRLKRLDPEGYRERSEVKHDISEEHVERLNRANARLKESNVIDI